MKNKKTKNESSQIDSLTVSETITLDLGDYNTSIPALTSTGISTISLDDIITTSVTLPNSYTISNGVTGSSYSTIGNYTWTQNSSTVHIDADGLTMKEGADIKVGGKSLMEAIEKIEERLGILKPNTDLEDRWEQLKDLRRQYMELEKGLLEKEKIMKILKET